MTFMVLMSLTFGLQTMSILYHWGNNVTFMKSIGYNYVQPLKCMQGTGAWLEVRTFHFLNSLHLTLSIFGKLPVRIQKTGFHLLIPDLNHLPVLLSREIFDKQMALGLREPKNYMYLWHAGSALTNSHLGCMSTAILMAAIDEEGII